MRNADRLQWNRVEEHCSDNRWHYRAVDELLGTSYYYTLIVVKSTHHIYADGDSWRQIKVELRADTATKYSRTFRGPESEYTMTGRAQHGREVAEEIRAELKSSAKAWTDWAERKHGR